MNTASETMYQQNEIISDDRLRNDLQLRSAMGLKSHGILQHYFGDFQPAFLCATERTKYLLQPHRWTIDKALLPLNYPKVLAWRVVEIHDNGYNW